MPSQRAHVFSVMEVAIPEVLLSTHSAGSCTSSRLITIALVIRSAMYYIVASEVVNEFASALRAFDCDEHMLSRSSKKQVRRQLHSPHFVCSSQFCGAQVLPQRVHHSGYSLTRLA